MELSWEVAVMVCVSLALLVKEKVGYEMAVVNAKKILRVSGVDVWMSVLLAMMRDREKD